VGDPDQCIYSWRCATIANILNFEKNFPATKIIFLEENYRSTQNILKAANAVIAKNIFRHKKNLFTLRPAGEKITLAETFDEKDEADFIVNKILNLRKKIPFEEIAVLYRTNWQSRILEEAFLEKNIPYEVVGLKFFARKEIKDVLSFLRASLNPESLSDLKRIINLPPRGIGKVTILKIFAGKTKELTPALQEKIKNFYALLEEIKKFSEKHTPAEVIKFVLEESGLGNWLKEGNEEDLERLENIKELVSLAKKYDEMPGLSGIQKLLEEASLSLLEEAPENKKGVKLMTIHAAKGLEFDAVFIVGLEEDLFPHVKSDEGDLEEERRLFYVGLTRAKKLLFLSFAHSRTIFGSRKSNFPSRFIDDLPKNLVCHEQGKTLSLL